MAADEAGTLATLKRHRETVFDPAVAAHNGRVVKLIGDGTIVEFASVVDAVNCALSVQRSGASAPDHRAAAIVLRVRFQDGGEITVKNIDRPIRIWRWQPGGAAANPRRPNAANPTAKAATASIAVLPFTNMSGDAEQEYFSDGISEDIITDLSKIAGLIVIARN
jgi:adenylate cyclase